MRIRDAIIQAVEDVTADYRARREAVEVMKAAGRAVYACPDCGEIFDSDGIWHCPVCDHHWPSGRTDCWNCHEYERPTQLQPMVKVC